MGFRFDDGFVRHMFFWRSRRGLWWDLLRGPFGRSREWTPDARSFGRARPLGAGWRRTAILGALWRIGRALSGIGKVARLALGSGGAARNLTRIFDQSARGGRGRQEASARRPRWRDGRDPRDHPSGTRAGTNCAFAERPQGRSARRAHCISAFTSRTNLRRGRRSAFSGSIRSGFRPRQAECRWLSIHKTVCPHDCPDTCSISATVEGGRVTSATATPTIRSPRVPLPQGTPVSRAIYSPDRILPPVAAGRKKGEGRFVRITWDEALDEIAGRLTRSQPPGVRSDPPYSYGEHGARRAKGRPRVLSQMGATRLRSAPSVTRPPRSLARHYGAGIGATFEGAVRSDL